LDYLMDSVPFTSVLVDGTAGWYRTPTAENYTDRNRNWWSVQTNLKSYDPFGKPDIYAEFRSNIHTGATLYKSFGTINQSSWALTGQITFDGSIPSTDYVKADTTGSGNVILDVVDYDNKVLVRLFAKYNDVTKTFIDYYANNQLLWRDSAFNSTLISKYWQNYSVTNTAGTLAISYAGHSISGLTPLDATANKNRPERIRVYLWSKWANNARRIGLKDFIFNR
jgi:hypothetical protein